MTEEAFPPPTNFQDWVQGKLNEYGIKTAFDLRTRKAYTNPKLEKRAARIGKELGRLDYTMADAREDDYLKGNRSVTVIDAEWRWFAAADLIVMEPDPNDKELMDPTINLANAPLLLLSIGSKYAIIDGNKRYWKWWHMGGHDRIMRGCTLAPGNVQSLKPEHKRWELSPLVAKLLEGKQTFEEFQADIAAILVARDL